MTDNADARPTKRFFIENFIRDIGLEDAILDLADNCVDSLVRSYGIEISANLLTGEGFERPPNLPDPPLIRIQVSEDSFEIADLGGGIEYDEAKDIVFRFGRPEDHIEGSLGVYGIGLKRALFKLGNNIEVESRTPGSGFRVSFRVDEWAADEDEWSFPMARIEGAGSLQESGTRIVVTELNEEVKLRLDGGGFLQGLADEISKTYSLFLDRFLTVELNGENIVSAPLPIGTSDELQPAHQTYLLESVTLELFAGLARRVDGEWSSERAGWYVLCNGRAVVFGDKGKLTGWGTVGPAFQPKHRGFVGIAFFFSDDPTTLPWTTTKRGLNAESRVYQLARKEMSAIAKPVLSFLNNMYPSEDLEEIAERDLADELKEIAVVDLAKTPCESFKIPDTSEAKEQRKTVSIQYKAKIADVDKIAAHLDHPEWSARQVGRYTFDHYLNMEIPE